MVMLLLMEELHIQPSEIDNLPFFEYEYTIQLYQEMLEDYMLTYDNYYGMVNVLSYHPLGGELIKLESAYYPGNGNIKSMGSLGETMKESVEIAFAYIKSHMLNLILSLL